MPMPPSTTRMTPNFCRGRAGGRRFGHVVSAVAGPSRVVGVLLAMTAAPVALQAQTIRTYSAEYSIEYKGRDAGTSSFSVEATEDPGQYRFISHSELKGLIARLVAPRPVIDDSRFDLSGAAPRPLEFRHEDGSRKGEDNYTIVFDWPANAVLTEGGNRHDIPLHAGILDRGSAQVALMNAAARGSVPATLDIIDDDGLETYALEAIEPASVSTGQGAYETVRYSQQRVGSSRHTIFWMAPALHHLPVRIEQIRDGEAQTVFELISVEFGGE